MRRAVVSWVLFGVAGACAAPQPTLRELFRYRPMRGLTTALAFDPTERLLACGGHGGDVVVYDVASGKPVITIDATHADVRTLAFDSKGEMLAVAGEDVSVWGVGSGRELRRFDGIGPTPRPAWGIVAWHPDGRKLAYLDRDWSANVVDVETGDRVVSDQDWNLTDGLVVSPDGSLRAAWTAEHREYSTEGRAHRVRLVDVTPEGSLIAVATKTHVEVRDRRFELVTSTPLGGSVEWPSWYAEYPDTRDRFGPRNAAVALGGSGRRFALAYGPGPVKMFENGELVASLEGNASRPVQAAMATGGTTVGWFDGWTWRVVDLETGRERHLGEASALARGPDDDSFVVAHATITIRDLDGSEREVFGRRSPTRVLGLHPKPATAPRGSMVSRTARDVALGCRDEWILLADIWRTEVRDVSWSRDGEWLALACHRLPGAIGNPGFGSLQLFRHGVEVPFDVGRSIPLTVAISPDESTVTWADFERLHIAPIGSAGEGATKRSAWVRWLRYAGDELVVSHDDQLLTLRRAPSLDSIEAFDPFHVRRSVRHGAWDPEDNDHVFGGDSEPAFIDCAELSADGSRLMVAGRRGVVVYAVESVVPP